MSDSTNTAELSAVAAAAGAAAAPFDWARSGASMARNDSQGSRLIMEFADALRGADFAAWEAARQMFEAGATSTGYLDAGKLWQRTVKAAQSLNLLGDKPKAAGKAAEVAAKRAAQAAEIAKVAEGKTPAQLRVEAAKHLAEGNASKESDAMLKAAEALEKAADKAARDKAREAIKAADDRIRAARTALKEAGAIKALQALADAAEKAVAKLPAKVAA